MHLKSHYILPLLMLFACTQTSSETSTHQPVDDEIFPVSVGNWWMYDYQTEYTEYRMLQQGEHYVKRSYLDGELLWEINNRNHKSQYGLKVTHETVQYDSVKVDGTLIWVDTLNTDGVNYYTIVYEAGTYTVEFSFPPSYFNPGLDFFEFSVERFIDPAIIQEDIFYRSTDMFRSYWLATQQNQPSSLYAYSVSDGRIRGNITDRYTLYSVPSIGIVLFNWEKHVTAPSDIRYDVRHTLNLLQASAS